MGIPPLKMRLIRLCESEGAFNTATYIALRDDLTIGDALEIEAAMCEIGDHRSAFAEFYSDYKQNPQKSSTPAPANVRVTLDDLQAELKYRESVRDRDRAAVMRHRAAVAYAASGQPEPEGRIERGALERLERSLESHEQCVRVLTAQIKAFDQ